MKLCFPVKEAKELESEVYGHFGSAPAFVVVDVDTNDVSFIGNSDRHHAHGMCNPVGALGGHEVDGVIVGGIGAGALMKLNRIGITVYKAEAGTVRDNLKLFGANRLPVFMPGEVCGGHSHGGGCAH